MVKKILEPDAVRQAMRELNIVTFYGPINFDETGKNTAKPMGSIQIQNGKIQLVAPPDTAVTQKIYPATKWKER